MTVGAALRLLQFGDSTFPVGAFSFSHGLESAVETGLVHDLTTLRDFVRTATGVAAGGDGAAVLLAHRAARAADPDRLRAVDAAVLARRLNEETRTMSVRTGRKLGEAAAVIGTRGVRAWLDEVRAGTTPGTWPAGLGLVAAALDLAETDAFALHQYGVAAAMLGAAVRLMRVHHLETQSILYAVDAEAPGDYARVRHHTLADLTAFAPMTDVLAAVHVHAHVRMFMN